MIDKFGHRWMASGPEDDDPWCGNCSQPMTHGEARLRRCPKAPISVTDEDGREVIFRDDAAAVRFAHAILSEVEIAQRGDT